MNLCSEVLASSPDVAERGLVPRRNTCGISRSEKPRSSGDGAGFSRKAARFMHNPG